MKFIACAVAACSILLAVAAPASAVTIYTDRASFNAVVTGAAVTTFEENASGATKSYSGGGYNGSGFSITSDGTLFTIDPDFDSFSGLYKWGTGPGSGDVLSPQFDPGTGLATVSLDSGVSAFGFDFGVPKGSLGGSGTITINGVPYSAVGQPVFNFFGLVATPGDGAFAPTLIDFGGNVGIIDNFTIASANLTSLDLTSAAPEPSTWLMMLTGFGLVGIALRRRQSPLNAG